MLLLFSTLSLSLRSNSRPVPPTQVLFPPEAGMADGRQPDEHWTANGQENGENGYSSYSYRENGYHGGAAAGTTGRCFLTSKSMDLT